MPKEPAQGTKSPQTYEADATVRAGGDGHFKAHGLSASFDATAGRVEDLAGPADLLCAALCACILKNVERFSHMLPFHYESAHVHVVAERTDPPPLIEKMHYALEVVTDESQDRVELLHRNIQKYGTITNTLGKACEVSGVIRAVSSGPPK